MLYAYYSIILVIYQERVAIITQLQQEHKFILWLTLCSSNFERSVSKHAFLCAVVCCPVIGAINHWTKRAWSNSIQMSFEACPIV